MPAERKLPAALLALLRVRVSATYDLSSLGRTRGSARGISPSSSGPMPRFGPFGYAVPMHRPPRFFPLLALTFLSLAPAACGSSSAAPKTAGDGKAEKEDPGES